MNMQPYFVRAMTPEDIPRLAEIRPGFISDSILRVEKTGDGCQVGWQLTETRRAIPFNKGLNYDFDIFEQQNIAERLARPDSLEEVVIELASGRFVGVLDVATEAWRHVAWIWNIMLDIDVRRQGLGRTLIERTIAWAREHNLRAIMLETQTNNVPACKFYVQMGFQLVGINDQFYTNHDLDREEVALFWSYPLKP
jgi:streptothricin acetyltransferase